MRIHFFIGPMVDDPVRDIPNPQVYTAPDRGSLNVGFSEELLSQKIKGRRRTFYVDLKKSSNGNFIKVTELSRGGQKSIVMFDAEDIDEFLAALVKIRGLL